MVTSGTKLGPYEIQTLLGEGGMGEVWKARDERLERPVAIKLCRDEFSERFAREARVVASLNHPHIATLYDVGPNYLVMEYVDGSAIKGPMPEEQAVELASQILDALDAAHRKNITHRDLKPANILVTGQGIKLLDFGLARINVGENDTTITKEGAIMGTPAYMAPETWQGLPSDVRSDIYSFGCVLYEMITGQQAATSRKPVSSPVIENVLHGCLERNPDDRWQSAKDVRRALNVPTVSRAKVARWWIATAAAALIVLLLSAFAIMRVNRSSQRQEPVRFTIPAPPSTAFTEASLSPDGKRMVISAMDQQGSSALWLRSLDTLALRALPGTAGAQFPFWSPDGRFMAFFQDRILRKIDLEGGVPQVVCELDGISQGGTWLPNGTILVAVNLSNLFSVPSSGGEPKALTKLNAARKETRHYWPSILPDGKHFLFSVASPLPEVQGVWVASMDDPEGRQRLLPDLSRAAYANNHLLFVHGGNLMAQPFDPDSLKLSREAVPLADRVNYDTAGGWADYSVSSNGVLAVGPAARQLRLTMFDRSGKALESFGAEAKRYQFVSLSHDETQVAADSPDAKFGYELYVFHPARGTTTQFTFGPATGNFPVWSPDGTRIAFGSNRDGVYDIYMKSAAGSSQEDLVLKNERNKFLMDWSRDGRYLLYGEQDPQKRREDLWVLPINGNKPAENQAPIPYVRNDFDHRDGRFSPDGRWVAYSSTESSRSEVYVQSFPAGPQRVQISTNGGGWPRWRDDGQELFYLEPGGKLMAVDLSAGPMRATGAPKPLFETGIVNAMMGFDVYRGGQKFVLPAVENKTPEGLTVILNWTSGLKN